MLALALKAQSDFERVELAARPGIPDTDACTQSQAAALAVSPPEERSLLLYRKAYCTYAGATATGSARQFQEAVAEFDRSIEAWPLRVRKPEKGAVIEPVAPSLRVFAAIARLHVATDAATVGTARQEMAAALDTPACKSNVMAPSFCADVLAAGAQWLGWMALRDGQVDEAARRFTGTGDNGWSAWAQGRREFAAGLYGVAAGDYARAVEVWRRIWRGQGPTLLQSLGPRPQYADALTDWGSARLLAGDLTGAITTLDTSLQANAVNAYAVFLRGRAKELAGQKEAALADYSLASRTALAAAQDLASGEAHLYRGIVHYRRREFGLAEQEFSTALNFEMTAALRPDARAWRHLAAVAGGFCGEARQSLTQALTAVSPFFPREEARTQASGCGTG